MIQFVFAAALAAILFNPAARTAALAAPSPGSESSVRTRESFNRDWRFARFGPMPDGSTRPEPGAAGWSIVASASSEERGKGNTADLAFDGDPATRWCAGGAGVGQWLMLDLGGAPRLGGLEADWEFPDMAYAFVVEGSDDGKGWKQLAVGNTPTGPKRLAFSAETRFVRVRPTSLPNAKWASIWEVRLFDAEGKLIKNRPLPASETPGAADFDDSGWRKLDVPHDWGIEGPFRDDLPNDTGKLPWKGVGWYRKHFTLPAGDQGKQIFVDFDGAMANAKVWLNGEYVGTWPYGYNAFRLELTPFAKFGAENVLAVQLDTVHWGSRWYPGAGLYRNVWLVKTAPVHVGHWGVYVTTPSLTDERGEAKLVVAVDNQAAQEAKVAVQTEILEMGSDGATRKKVAASAVVEQSIASKASGQVEVTAIVPQPKRWDLATPNRYLARTKMSVGGRVVDTYLGRWAPPSMCAPWSGSLRSSRKWETTRCAPLTIRPRPSCSSWPIAWASL
ncbi:MAG: discoidin domain-containing protein [Verrucomicrobia bacterium]|nr:discoidin domain-containing protein [Verrucomicrobiota bacterium]